jgi:hypothetical protein
MKDFDSITAVKENIDAQGTAAVDIAKMAMMVVGTAVSVYYLTGKVMQFKSALKNRQLKKETKS